MFADIPFNSFGEFLDMGGYAFNVWSVYFLFLVFVLVNLLGPLWQRKRILLQLRRRQARQASPPPVDEGERTAGLSE